MVRILTQLFVAAVVFSAPLAAQEPPKFKPVILPSVIRFVQAFSQDRQACTMLFDNFTLATEAGRGSLPSAKTKHFTYVLQPEVTSAASVRHDIRGFFWRQGGANATLVVHAGGETTVVDLDKAAQDGKIKPNAAGSSSRDEASKLAKQLGLEGTKRPDRSSDFFASVETKVSPGKPLEISLLLLVDRPTSEDAGSLLIIDSIDFEIRPAAASKGK
jgi:hypothetical protein